MGAGLGVGHSCQRSFSSFPTNLILLPSIFRDGAGDLDLDGAIRIDDAHCFTDESSRQRREDNTNAL